MVKESENIELRSEKVRNIIGQIPPSIVRYGITVIFFIITIIIIGTYYFKYPETINTTAYFKIQNNKLITYISIPASDIDKVTKRNKVIITLDNILNLNNEKLETQIIEIANKITINKKEAFCFSKLNLTNPLITVNGKKLQINENLSTNAQIIIGNTSVFEQIINPIKNIFKTSVHNQ